MYQQNVADEDALVAKGDRPLVHQVRRDSKVKVFDCRFGFL